MKTNMARHQRLPRRNCLSRRSPSEVSFRLSRSYGLLTARDAHEWFLRMMAENEEFEVETDEPGESPLSFWTEIVRGVMVE